LRTSLALDPANPPTPTAGPGRGRAILPPSTSSVNALPTTRLWRGRCRGGGPAASFTTRGVRKGRRATGARWTKHPRSSFQW